MQTALRKMGNSTGMILPRSILGEIGVTVGAAMDLRVENGRLIVTPIVTMTRAGWMEDATAIASAPRSDDEQAWLDVANEGDAELTW